MTVSNSLTTEELALIFEGDQTQPMYVYQDTVPAELQVLKSNCIAIDPQDANVKMLIARMFKTVTDGDRAGVGIAAPQVGLNRRLFLVKRFDKANEPFEFFINPQITWYSAVLQQGEEGCLSIEDRYDAVYRSLAVQITYFDLEGNHYQEVVEGYTAVIIQHEYDHLNGILFTDRIEEQEQRKYEDATLETPLVYEV
ncbi:peptide deformylase [Myroides odoratus]|uniref:Peptide deformylase n=1 Tax=Myroides odoratus TaxID=256 RepID=A0A378RPP2_MYROD|nr:peptide deformylase [Myroides odoratus]QQU03940.1 peptide deformylase [Myroides odoratus]STZ28678.1 Peptide deformylase [Myroides odoratus]